MMIQKTEVINQHILNHILTNQLRYFQELTERLNDRGKDVDKGYFKVLEGYLRSSVGGKVSVSYNQIGNTGRFFVKGSSGLQSIQREIRNSICGEFYTDIDIKNAHPVILEALCHKHDIDCKRLSEYCQDRDKIIKDIVDKNDGLETRETVKQAILSIINNSNAAYKSIENKTKFLRKFKREIADIHDDILEIYPEYVSKAHEKSDNKNIKGSAINHLMCEYENKILMCAHDYFESKSVDMSNAVLCFDGIMVKSKDTEMLNGLLDELNAVVYAKFKIPAVFVIKPMTERLTINMDEVEDYVEYQPFDHRDPFTWLDFVKKYHNGLFDSMDDLYSKTIVDINRVYAYTHSNDMSIKKMDCADDLFNMSQRSNEILVFKVKQAATKDKPPIIKNVRFIDYRREFLLKLNNHSNVDFDPSLTNDNIFNLWRGYEAVVNESFNSVRTIDGLNKKAKADDGLKIILKHILDIYCDGDDASYQYFLTLLHAFLKYPDKPLEIVTFLYSKGKGTGKNTLLDFIRDYVVGSRYTLEVAGLKAVLNDFNSSVMNKKMIIVDELASSSDTFSSNFDRLKTLITSYTVMINKKGIDQFKCKNLVGYFFLSNHQDAVKIEQGDRRYFCLRYRVRERMT